MELARKLAARRRRGTSFPELAQLAFGKQPPKRLNGRQRYSGSPSPSPSSSSSSYLRKLVVVSFFQFTSIRRASRRSWPSAWCLVHLQRDRTNNSSPPPTPSPQLSRSLRDYLPAGQLASQSRAAQSWRGAAGQVRLVERCGMRTARPAVNKWLGGDLVRGGRRGRRRRRSSNRERQRRPFAHLASSPTEAAASGSNLLDGCAVRRLPTPLVAG